MIRLLIGKYIGEYIYIFFEIYRYNNIFIEEKEYVFLSTVYNDNLLYIFLNMNID